MKDKKILDLLKSGKQSEAFDGVYKHFPKVKRMILSKGGNEEDAKDIFQESVIVFYKNVMKVDFVLTSAISTYLYSVSYNLWLKKIRDVYNKEHNTDTTLYVIKDEVNDFDSEIEYENKRGVLESVMLKLGDKCVDLLKRYYFKKQSMKEIASEMGFDSDKIAKNHKYKCMEKARKMAADEWVTKQESIA